METEKNNWFDSYVTQAINSLGKILTEEGLAEQEKTEQIDTVLNMFWESITKYIKPENTEILFYDPLLNLRNKLIKKSYMVSVEKEYTNWLLHACIKFINDSPSQEIFYKTYQEYREFVLYDLGLVGHTRGYFYNVREFNRLLQILEQAPEEVWKEILSDKEENKTELYPWNDSVTMKKNSISEKDSIGIEIPVVLAADNNYALQMMVTIASMLQTAAESTVYHFYLLVSGDFSEENKKRIVELCSQRAEWKVDFINMQSAYKNTYIKIAHISTATYYRLQLPSLLKEIDKCIYLDIDLVVKHDLSELFLTDIENQYIAGVRAAGYYGSPEKIEYQKNRLGISDFSTYVNAGVLVLNLRKMREDGLEEKCAELIEKEWESQDQDILNVACLGKIRLLNTKYNVMTKYPLDDDEAYDKVECLKRAYLEQEWEDGRKEPVIIHYADRIKPWKVPGSVYAKDWWDVVDMMPVDIAADIYHTYVGDMLMEARQVKQSLDHYEKLYKEVKKQGAFENERIYKYKLQYETKEQKERIEDLLKREQQSKEKMQEVLNKQDKLEKKIKKLNSQIQDIKQSRSYKIGRIFTFIPRKIKSLF